MSLGLGDHILETINELKETSKRFLEPTQTYQARITPRNSQFIIKEDLETYIEQSLETINEDDYDVNWSITDTEELMDPHEAKNLYANKGPSDRAYLKLETTDQETIDQFISGLESNSSEYIINSNTSQDIFH